MSQRWRRNGGSISACFLATLSLKNRSQMAVDEGWTHCATPALQQHFLTQTLLITTLNAVSGRFGLPLERKGRQRL